jgi:signal transduction histidine kinase/DNA-binding response OmpR family regulator
MKYLIPFFLCTLLHLPGSSQDVHRSVIEEKLGMELSDQERAHLLNTLSWKYQGEDYNKAYQYAQDAYYFSKSKGLDYENAVSVNRLAHSLWSQGRADEAISLLMGNLPLLKLNDKKWNQIRTESYRLLGTCYFEFDPKLSEHYSNVSLSLAKANNDSIFLVKAYLDLGVLKESSNDYVNSISYLDSALLIASNNHQLFISPVIKIRKLITSFNLMKNGKNKFTLEDEIASFYLNAILSVIEQAKVQKNHYALAIAFRFLGEVYVQVGRYYDAERSVNQSLRMAESLHLKEVVRKGYQTMATIKLNQKDFRNAYDYQEKFHSLNDSILNERKARQIALIETQLASEKKENEINLLMQKSKLETRLKSILIIGILLLLIALIICLELNHSRQKKATELLKAQAQLNVKLKETDEIKRRFFANISHEFKTPLSLIIAPLEERIKESSSSEEKQDLELIKRNAGKLMSLINELLDLSKLEVGKLKLTLNPIDINSFIEKIALSFEPMAYQKKIDFQCSVPIKKITGWMDEDKMEKILNNLLSNAFKFTPSGGVITLAANIDNANRLILNVKDTGIGISKEDQSRIFEPFFQGKENSSQGTGLGLSLVKQLVTIHLGVVDFESHIGQGTSFRIIIPIDEQAYQQVEEKHSDVVTEALEKEVAPHKTELSKINDNEVKHEPGKPMLLLVEDNNDMLEFLSKSFKSQYNVFTASNGIEGFNFAIEQIPDLIISDVMMPMEDGLSMLRRLRENQRTSHIPIILLTAKGQTDIRIEGFRAGADDFISKPFSNEELVVRANSILEQRNNLTKRHHQRYVTSTLPVTDSSLDEKFLQKIKSFIEDNMSDTQFSVEKLAEDMNLSRAQLFRKLKGLIGISPNKLINDIRLQRAADLISAKADTLTQIGYRVGFNEHSYFAKRFKEKFGVTPGEYVDSINV